MGYGSGYRHLESGVGWARGILTSVKDPPHRSL